MQGESSAGRSLPAIHGCAAPSLHDHRTNATLQQASRLGGREKNFKGCWGHPPPLTNSKPKRRVILAILPRPSRRPLRCDVLRRSPDRMMIAAAQGAGKGCKFATCHPRKQVHSSSRPKNLRHLAAKLACPAFLGGSRGRRQDCPPAHRGMLHTRHRSRTGLLSRSLVHKTLANGSSTGVASTAG
jgi:hypothetical protein